MMSLLVYTGRRSYGALSVYADRRRAFDEDDVAVMQALAAHLAVIIAAGRQIDQLGVAMHNRTIIGQAQGILMRQLDISANQAFDYLRRVSSQSNRKVSVIAMDIARTRQLPSHPRSGALVAGQLDITRNTPSRTPSPAVVSAVELTRVAGARP
jgi:GAF domain-containing protein